MKINLSRLIKEESYCKRVFEFFIKTKSLRKEEQLFFEKHLNKSLDNLQFANFILDEHKHSIKEKLPAKSFYDWCVVIYYYALYHSVLALLSKTGYKSKNHLATISSVILFYYHKSNILNKEDIQFIIDKINLDEVDIDFMINSKELRERASYRVDESFDLLLAQRLQKETVEFVNKIKNILEESQGGSP